MSAARRAAQDVVGAAVLSLAGYYAPKRCAPGAGRGGGGGGAGEIGLSVFCQLLRMIQRAPCAGDPRCLGQKPNTAGAKVTKGSWAAPVPGLKKSSGPRRPGKHQIFSSLATKGRLTIIDIPSLEADVSVSHCFADGRPHHPSLPTYLVPCPALVPKYNAHGRLPYPG